MNKHTLLLLALSPAILFAQQNPEPIKTPQEIQLELEEDEKLYNKALDMFNPWYTGPLLTPSANMMPPGYGNVQPYLFIIDSYASFDSERVSRSNKSSEITLNPSLSMQFGITTTMDISLAVQGFGNWQYEESGGGYGDMGITVGWPITRQGLYLPAIKFTLSQSFPTGRYQHLSTNGYGLSGTGAGAWSTRFGLAITKLLFWNTQHPLNTRLFVGYTVSTPVTVHGFNSYGGGYGTKGRVHPGGSFEIDLGLEVALTQNWVLANDLVYTFQNATHFSGNPGTATPGGAVASVGGPYSDNLSLAPAIEYNFSPNLGLLFGTQFSVYGRSSSNFASAIMSVTWTFGPM